MNSLTWVWGSEIRLRMERNLHGNFDLATHRGLGKLLGKGIWYATGEISV